MTESFLASLDYIPRGRLFLGTVAVVWFLQVVAIGSARRRLRATGAAPTGRASRLERLAGLAILVLPLLAVTSVHAARVTMLGGFSGTDPSQKAAAISRGIAGQLNTIPFATVATTIAVLLWLVARAAARPHRRVSSVALVGLGLAAIFTGVLQWTIHLIQVFATLAGLPPDDKSVVLIAALDVARSQLQLFSRISTVTIVGLSVVAAVWTLFDRRTPPEATVGVGQTSVGRTLGSSLAALLLAAVLVLAARPWRVENDLPWPPAARGDNLLIVTPTTPELEGPDNVQRAPVVQVFSEEVALDGFRCSPDELESKLVTIRNYFALLSPGERFNQVAIIIADRKLPSARVRSILRIVHDAGYSRPLLAFTRAERVMRPTFGPLARVRGTAASLALFDDQALELELEEDRADRLSRTVVQLEDFADYDARARRVVELRRQGKGVALDLGQ